MAQLSSRTTPEKPKRQHQPREQLPTNNLSKEPAKGNDEDMKRPWQTLVSYVDELTVGGRKNSQGQYVDAMGNFPGFGKQKEPKVPENCFPRQCYDAYVFIQECLDAQCHICFHFYCRSLVVIQAFKNRFLRLTLLPLTLIFHALTSCVCLLTFCTSKLPNASRNVM